MSTIKAFNMSASAELERSGDHSDMELPMLDPARKRSLSADLPASPVTPAAASTASRRTSAPATTTDDADTRSLPLKVFHFVITQWEKFVILAVIITLIVLVSVKGFTVFDDILNWFQKRNNWISWVIFLGMYCANVALLLPGVVFILGAGFVFGFWKGLLATWVGGGIGQALAFLLSRYLLRDWLVTLVKRKWAKWDVVDKAIELDGWKLLLLLRLTPLVPYNLLNITMATTRMHFWPFAIVSFFGIIPEAALLVYFGSLAENIKQIVGGEAGPHGPVTYVIGGVGLVCITIATVWATIVVRRAIRRAEATMRDEEGLDTEDVEQPVEFVEGVSALPPEGFYTDATLHARPGAAHQHANGASGSDAGGSDRDRDRTLIKTASGRVLAPSPRQLSWRSKKTRSHVHQGSPSAGAYYSDGSARSTPTQRNPSGLLAPSDDHMLTDLSAAEEGHSRL